MKQIITNGHRALTRRFNILENIPVFIIIIYKHIIYIRKYLILKRV